MRFLHGALAGALLCVAGYSISGAPSKGIQSGAQASVAAPSGAQGNDLGVTTHWPKGSDQTAPETNSKRAWDAEVEKAGRSWQESYCQWAWAHDLPVFPALDSDPNKIARGDATNMSVHYFVAGANLSGTCRFTSEGRAVPVKVDQANRLADRLPATGRSSGHAAIGALVDGLEYASTDTDQVETVHNVRSAATKAWFPALLVSAHGEPLHAIADGYVPRYAYHSHAECMAATRRNVQPMASTGVRGRFLCMYHGESDRDLSLFPMEEF